MWNLDAFAQDSWKIRSNLTLEVGVRAGYWTNNAELNGLGNWFDPDHVRSRTRAPSSIPVRRALNGVRYAALRPGAARAAPESPAVRAAARQRRVGHPRRRRQRAPRRVRDVREPADGNVELRATRCRVPRTRTTSDADAFYDHGPRRAGTDIRHVRLIPFADADRHRRRSSRHRHRRSFTFPRTDSYSVSYARRIFWNQVVEAAYVGTHGTRPRRAGQRSTSCPSAR